MDRNRAGLSEGLDELEKEMEREMEKHHLCNSCLYQMPTCSAEKIVWSIDKYPNAKGADADRVLQCDGYSLSTRSSECADNADTHF